MNDHLARRRLTAAIQACTDGPWEHALPWGEPGFASRFVRITDDEAQRWGPPEPDVSRLLDIWSHNRGPEYGGALPSVLDLACGAGRHAMALAWLGCEVIGVDIAGAAIDRALEKAQRRRLSRPGFVEADISNYDPGRTFDVIQLLSGQCSNFPAQELAGIIRRYLGHLSEGGVLILELPGPLPDAEAAFRTPGQHGLLFSDRPYWEMRLTEVDPSTRLACDRYAVLTESDDRVSVFANWRLFYPAEWIAQMLPSDADLRVDRRRSRPDWCVIVNRNAGDASRPEVCV